MAEHLKEETYNSKAKSFIFDDRLEKNLVDLYLESESFPIEVENYLNTILILKHQDWLKDAFKCVENKKFSEKLNRKVLSHFYSLFNKENYFINCEGDNSYFNNISAKANELFIKISDIYEANLTIVNLYKSKDKEIPVENILNNNDTQFILDEMNQYNSWVENLDSSMNAETMTDELFKSFVERAKTFKFKTSFLEKFKLISNSFSVDKIDYYRLMLFDKNNSDNKKKEKLILVNKIKK
jgi:hypothetical protein